MKAKRINRRMWRYGSHIIWRNTNADNHRVWGVLSKKHVVLTNGFSHFYQAANFINTKNGNL